MLAYRQHMTSANGTTGGAGAGNVASVPNANTDELSVLVDNDRQSRAKKPKSKRRGAASNDEEEAARQATERAEEEESQDAALAKFKFLFGVADVTAGASVSASS
jgi:hypothetical protein